MSSCHQKKSEYVHLFLCIANDESAETRRRKIMAHELSMSALLCSYVHRVDVVVDNYLNRGYDFMRECMLYEIRCWINGVHISNYLLDVINMFTEEDLTDIEVRVGKPISFVKAYAHPSNVVGMRRVGQSPNEIEDRMSWKREQNAEWYVRATEIQRKLEEKEEYDLMMNMKLRSRRRQCHNNINEKVNNCVIIPFKKYMASAVDLEKMKNKENIPLEKSCLIRTVVKDVDVQSNVKKHKSCARLCACVRSKQPWNSRVAKVFENLKCK